MAIRLPVRRVTLENVGDTVKVEEDQLVWPETQQAHGGYKITLWECDSPKSKFVLIKWAADSWIDFHVTPAINYIYIVEGELEFHAQQGGSVVHLKAGDVILGKEIMRGWKTPKEFHAVILAANVFLSDDAE